ncbi:MAG: hypothetical protein QNJ38_02565 [Prochloraceae cyanobacterium]|nr:hypothetical protein [Prochloraceae cyanobacterium]
MLKNISAILLLNLILLAATPATSQTQPNQTIPNNDKIDLDPQKLENSPTFKRWLKKVPDVLRDIRNDPAFNTRLRVGYSQYPSSGDVGGLNLAVEDVFIGRTGLTISADYNFSFNGDRASGGANLHYFILPLGSYVNIAPILGYRYIQTGDFSTDGVNLGARLMLPLTRTGAADLSISQSFVSPGGREEVGITTLGAGYAVTSNLRLFAEIQKENSIAEKDSRVGISLEWMIQ